MKEYNEEEMRITKDQITFKLRFGHFPSDKELEEFVKDKDAYIKKHTYQGFYDHTEKKQVREKTEEDIAGQKEFIEMMTQIFKDLAESS